MPTTLLASLFLIPPATAAGTLPSYDCVPHFDAARAVIIDQWHFIVDPSIDTDPGRIARAMRPEAERASSAAECAGIIRRFLASLEDGHLRLRSFPGEPPWTRPQGIRLGRVGADGEDARLFVLAVDPEAPGLAGVQPGAEVVRIDGLPVREQLERVRERTSASTAAQREFRVDAAVLDGPAGTQARVVVAEESGGTRDVILPRPGRPAAAGRRTEAAPLPRGYARIRLGSLDSRDDVAAFDEALSEHFDARGLVLDLRGVEGGDLRVAERVGGRFLPVEIEVARVFGRPAEQPPIAFLLDSIRMGDRGRTYPGALVVLVDAGCFGPCEVLSGGLQGAGRALVVGATPTGGGGGSRHLTPFRWGHPAYRKRWEFKTALHYGIDIRLEIEQARVVARWPDGSPIAGVGVQPDARATLSLDGIVAGRDEALEEAVRVLEREGHATTAAALAPAGPPRAATPIFTAVGPLRLEPFVGVMYFRYDDASPYRIMGARLSQAVSERTSFAAAVWGVHGRGRVEADSGSLILAGPGLEYLLIEDPVRLAVVWEAGKYWGREDEDSGTGLFSGILFEAAHVIPNGPRVGVLSGMHMFSHGPNPNLLFGLSLGFP